MCSQFYHTRPEAEVFGIIQQENKSWKITLMMRKTDEVWHSPLNVFRWESRLAKKVGREAIEKEGKYQKVREARIAAVVALVMYKIRDIPAYVQLPEKDPPDAYVLQESKKKKGQADISTLEITTYYNDSEETLLEQLKRKKVPPTHPIYSDEYVLVVEIGVREPPIDVDFDEIREYLNDTGVEFPVWVIRDNFRSGDTVAEVVIVNPKTHKFKVNVGEAAHTLKTKKFHDVLFVKQGTPKTAGKKETARQHQKPPWNESLLGN